MSTLPSSAELTALLEGLVAEHNIPGTSVAIRRADELVTAVAGVLNIDSGATVTPESLFQIGSTSKVITATLVMQLVDAGELELEASVETYLPGFRLAGGVGKGAITVRHLLTHTSGIDGGDYIADFGTGDDAVTRYVDSLAGIGLVHPVGRYWSYCNAATVVAGRIVEVLTGMPWDRAVHELLVGPLSLEHTVAIREAPPHANVAVGHTAEPGNGGVLRVHPTRTLPVALGPAGSVLNATAADLAAIGLVHVAGGLAPAGARVLSAASVAAMQQPQFAAAFRLGSGTTGIGWNLGVISGVRVAVHDGSTLGQKSLFVVLPDHGVSLVSLTNSYRGDALTRAVLNDLVARFAGADTRAGGDVAAAPTASDPAPPDLDLAQYAGRYERTNVSATVDVADGALRVTTAYSGWLEVEKPAEQPVVLRPVSESRFVALGDQGQPGRQVAFTEPDDRGRPAYLIAGRVARRRGEL